MKKVYLGGTVGKSKWRDELIKKLNIEYFNPVVEEWDEQAMERELYERQNCDYLLYVITPQMEGVYAIAEVVDDSNKKPEKTLFCFLNNSEEFTPHQTKSLKAVGKLVVANGARWLEDLDEVARTLNLENS